MTRSFTLSQLFALLVVFAACMLVKLWPNPVFFFHDDIQHQYLPVYYEVGRSLLQGRLELESIATWFGGDLVVEYQYALFNPLALGTYALLPRFDSLAAAATVVGVIWYFVLCAGTYAVVRSNAGHAPALLGVAIIGTNPLTAYWFASAWLPGLLSLAWFPWLLLGLSDALGGRLIRAALVAFACFGIATAGWPHGLIAMGLTVGIFAATELRHGRSRSTTVGERVLPAVGGTLLAAPAWLPVVIASGASGRPSLVANSSDFLVAPLSAVANAAFPTHVDFMYAFGGFERFSAPFFYVAPLLALLPLSVSRERWRAFRSVPAVATMLTLVVVFLVASLGPSNLGPLRWPFRFLLYAHLLVAILLPLLLRNRLILSRQRVTWCIGYVVLSLLIALQKTPELWREHLVAFSLLCGTVLSLVGWERQHRERPATWLLVVWTIVCTAYVHVKFPANSTVSDWSPPARIAEFGLPPGTSPGDRVLFVSSKPTPGMAGGPEIYSGNLSLFTTLESVNGYSPLRPRELERTYCMSLFGTTCPLVSKALTQSADGFDVTPAELAGIDKVIVRTSEKQVLRALERSPRFVPCGAGNFSRTYCSTRPVDLPRPVTWTAVSVSVLSVTVDRNSTVKLRLVNGAPSIGKVVLAMPWRAGRRVAFSATAGTSLSMPIAPHPTGTLVLDVPARFDGEATVTRAFPFGARVAGTATLGALLLLVTIIWLGRMRDDTGCDDAASARH